MVSTFHVFGLAIGWMDIVGAIIFELAIIYWLRQGVENALQPDVEARQVQRVNGRKLYGSHSLLRDNKRIWIFWVYLLLLNVWIGVTMLLIAGILMHKPELMIFWLIWCAGGLVFDVFFVLWWLLELIAGDFIDALTNILISLLTMAIEFGFIYIVYNIYLELSLTPDGAKTSDSMLSFFIY
ncbi:uncharacterized protein LOC115622990 [Scaptodrosophila lebanonensis]|uniref:Uncharacterized protein LOC115622990 n=1 Tax=Drosophila lebanonensis TaxID=7225 RepID=A0A6J2TCA0_DROLE|nr:uncharacterized protein LOC115622990 [Scaptodrosophila lebanonensis]